MPIRRKRRVYDMITDLIPRIELAHDSLTNIVTALRATGQALVWTIEPPAGAGPRFSAQGWVDHFTTERARLMALRDVVGPIMQRVYPEVYDDAADYVTTVPTIVAAINTVLDLHRDGATLRNETLTNGQRNALANAIEAELEA